MSKRSRSTLFLALCLAACGGVDNSVPGPHLDLPPFDPSVSDREFLQECVSTIPLACPGVTAGAAWFKPPADKVVDHTRIPDSRPEGDVVRGLSGFMVTGQAPNEVAVSFGCQQHQHLFAYNCPQGYASFWSNVSSRYTVSMAAAVLAAAK